MSTAEYYQLSIELISLYNWTFEFWLTISFAFVIAVHFVSQKATRRLLDLMMVIYAVSSALFTFRFALGTISAGKLTEDMMLKGIPAPPFSVEPWQGLLVLSTMFTLMIVGSTAALYYAYRQRRGT